MNIRTVVIQYIVVVMLASVSFSAMAIPIGFENRGDTTFDQSSGLEWLDVSLTRGLSYASVSADIGAGTFTYGTKWRYATRGEFVVLAESWFGTTLSGSQRRRDYNYEEPLIDEFIEVFGQSGNGSNYDMSKGWIHRPNAGGMTKRSAVVKDRDTSTNTNYINTDWVIAWGHTMDNSVNRQRMGSWLVAEVPEPTSVLLFCAGVLGLGLHRRRRT